MKYRKEENYSVSKLLLFTEKKILIKYKTKVVVYNLHESQQKTQEKYIKNLSISDIYNGHALTEEIF